jgi:hypothetical protein
MQWSDVSFNPPTRTLRQFAGLCLLIGAALAAWRYFPYDDAFSAAVVLTLALLIGLPGLVRPALVRPVFVGWMVLAFPIGWTVSRLLLGLIYYGIFTPLGLCFRWSGRDPLARERRADRETYWEPKPAAASVRSYFRQF